MFVTREDDGHVAVLTLNRPEKLNALGPELLLQLRQHMDEIAGDGSGVHCVVLRGAGRSFCAGADLDAIKARRYPADDRRFGAKLLAAMEAMPQPVIAAVHGHCYTGGLELAVAADFIVAAESARFRDTHASWGAVPAWGLTARLPRRVGPAAAKDIILTCRTVAADEALRIGLADRVVSEATLTDAALALAAQIAANVFPAIAAGKKLVNGTLDMPLADALEFEYQNLPRRREVEAHLQAYWPKEAPAG